MGSPTFSHSTIPSEPEPLPHFVFPMKPEPNTGSASSTLGSTASTSQRKRPLSKTRPQHISVNALPPFEFHPSSGGSSAATSPTPPRSPNKAAPHPSRVGHRRGGSEFIGGDGKPDGPGLMSSSPTKGEGMLPPPPSASRMGPPGGRRGHAHRRSGAVSSHDITNILRPSNVDANRPESAPATPSEPSLMQQYLPNHDKASSQPSLVPTTSQSQSPVPRHASLPSAGHARPRVGFSDTLEFIPRPLSTISSETSSSFSTIRPGHSVTGSISSVVSAGTSSPPSARVSRSSHDLPRVDEGVRARPSTASASLDSPSLKSVMHAEGTRKRPSSASGSPNPAPGQRGMPSYSTGRLSNTEMRFRSDVGSLGSPRSGEERSIPAHAFQEKPSASFDGRVKTQRKVKSWAGSILNKRGKSTGTVEMSRPRPPTPPLRPVASAEDFSLDDLNFDDEEEELPIEAPVQPARIDFSTWKPRQMSPRLPSDTLSPTLDLDAAMGPFNTPSMSSDSDQSSGSGFSAAKRRMHSAGATGAFSGPGMHYHRRAESAPEMAPVTDSAFDAYHMGNTTAMADVFEEEEEDDRSADEATEVKNEFKRGKKERLHGLGVAVADSADDQATVHGRRRRKQLDNMKDSFATPLSPTLQLPSASSTPVSLDLPVEIVDATEEPRFSVVTKSSDESTITPTLSANVVHDPLHPVPAEFAFPSFVGGLSAPSETASSVLSSPDYANTSFDVPRSNTAHSSITDRTAWSISKASERGSHEHMYPAADDVPSLTSSASTMTHPSRISHSGHSSQQPPPNPSPYTDNRRSASLSAMAVLGGSRPASPNKRSSLASLSRLIGSSHGEKSKLSIESTPTDEGEGTQRKKRNRVSRLMKFWKSKEKLQQA